MHILYQQNDLMLTTICLDSPFVEMPLSSGLQIRKWVDKERTKNIVIAELKMNQDNIWNIYSVGTRYEQMTPDDWYDFGDIIQKGIYVSST